METRYILLIIVFFILLSYLVYSAFVDQKVSSTATGLSSNKNIVDVAGTVTVVYLNTTKTIFASNSFTGWSGLSSRSLVVNATGSSLLSTAGIMYNGTHYIVYFQNGTSSLPSYDVINAISSTDQTSWTNEIQVAKITNVAIVKPSCKVRPNGLYDCCFMTGGIGSSKLYTLNSSSLTTVQIGARAVYNYCDVNSFQNNTPCVTSIATNSTINNSLYIYCQIDGWTEHNITSKIGAGTGFSTSLAIDSYDNMFIPYMNLSNQTFLAYAKKGNLSSFTTLFVSNRSCFFPDIDTSATSILITCQDSPLATSAVNVSVFNASFNLDSFGYLNISYGSYYAHVYHDVSSSNGFHTDMTYTNATASYVKYLKLSPVRDSCGFNGNMQNNWEVYDVCNINNKSISVYNLTMDYLGWLQTGNGVLNLTNKSTVCVKGNVQFANVVLLIGHPLVWDWHLNFDSNSTFRFTNSTGVC